MTSSSAFVVGCACVLVACTSDTSSLAGRDGTSSSGGERAGETGEAATTSSDGSTADLCVSTINEYRRAKGLAPYVRWAEAETCSDGQAKSDGQTSSAHGAFGRCGELAQNECPGWPGPPEQMIPKCLAAMMDEGPGGGHHDAMMSRRYTKVACGFATTARGAVWSVQNFK